MSREIKGHLKIEKIYKDKIEVVTDDHNVIVSGMGVVLSTLFSGEGSTSILDYQIKYASIGKGTNALATSTVGLDDPIDDSPEYGVNAITEYLTPLQNGVVQSELPFLVIPVQHISKTSSTSVTYKIPIEADASLSSDPISEIGLFVKNYTGNATDLPILVAYKTFTSIDKSTDFSLLFTWTITW
jgi:hypothetical protein